MLFSVIIPAYNREHYIRETIASVVSQTFTDYEIIVVDDGSTDGTAGCVASLGVDVRLLRQANGGPGTARNTGATHAHGEYLAFLDSDDLWFPWTLAAIAEVVETYKRPALISGIAHPFSHSSELLICQQGAMQVLHFPTYLHSSTQSPYNVGSNAAVVRRDASIRAGGFPSHNMNAEDHDFFLRMGTLDGFAQVVSPWTSGWRQHHDNASAQMDKNASGLLYVLAQEKSGKYPGDALFKRSRIEIISAHVRPAALKCLKAGVAREGWNLYTQTFLWHLKMLRVKFLAGFILLFVWCALSRQPRGAKTSFGA